MASRWTEKAANDWYAQQPWLVGANYIPASPINELERWQADTFDGGSTVSKFIQLQGEAGATQPLTSGVWKGDWPEARKRTPMERVQLEQSDIISFHSPTFAPTATRVHDHTHPAMNQSADVHCKRISWGIDEHINRPDSAGNDLDCGGNLPSLVKLLHSSDQEQIAFVEKLLATAVSEERLAEVKSGLRRVAGLDLCSYVAINVLSTNEQAPKKRSATDEHR